MRNENYKKIMCAADMIRSFRERAKSCGVSLDGSNYKEILDETEWRSYEDSVAILAQIRRNKTLGKQR